MPPAVQIEALTKQYGNVRALDDISFDVASGEWVAIMGPSGSGKTTLVNILGGLDSPSSGRVLVGGAEMSGLHEAALTRFRAEKVGFIFQQFHLVPYLSAVENVMLAQYFHSMTDEKEARLALQRVGLADRLHHRPSQLSGGEQQRVAVARALINHPTLILADEPTGNLDETNEEIVIQLFHELHSEGHTIVMVTHDPVMGRRADRRIHLAHGRLMQITGPSQENEENFDRLLEQIWVCGERNVAADSENLRAAGIVDPLRLAGRLAGHGAVVLSDSQVTLTPEGRQRARDVVRRHRLAERLFTDTFAATTSEADSRACRFEHIISPELDQKICTFLGHPATCPHGSAIPPGSCCPPR